MHSLQPAHQFRHSIVNSLKNLFESLNFFLHKRLAADNARISAVLSEEMFCAGATSSCDKSGEKKSIQTG